MFIFILFAFSFTISFCLIYYMFIKDYNGNNCRVVNNKVIFPKRIKEIPDEAFVDTEIKTVVIPDSVRLIGYHAFHGCKITSVTIPRSVRIIDDNAFYFSSLNQVVFCEGVKEIGCKAFCNCNLKKVVLPKSIKEVGRKAFANNRNLAEFSIADGAKNVHIAKDILDGGPFLFLNYLKGNGWYYEEREDEYIILGKYEDIDDSLKSKIESMPKL